MRVLVIEDDAELAELIAVFLRRRQLAVDVAFDGRAGLDRALFTNYDVVVLDRDLPGLHGDEVCAEIAAAGCRARVLMLTASASVQDRVEGLDKGADDYLPKPFALAELAARIRALLRRAESALPPVVVHGDVADNAYPTALATVTLGSLSAQQQVGATLGYAGSYSALNQAAGVYTQLPAAGQVVRRGQVLYQVSGDLVVLLYGSVPAYRSLSEGMAGADVRQLNANLVALGYATSAELDPTCDCFSAETASALELYQDRLGITATGSLALGQAVFLPSAARVTTVIAQLGAQAGPGSPVLQATSTRRQVSIALDAAEQSFVRDGDTVSITLPGNRSTPGVVSYVGTVATTPPSSGGTSSTPVITVDVTPSDPAATGHLDQAPVQVSITTATVSGVLIVPGGCVPRCPPRASPSAPSPACSPRCAPPGCHPPKRCVPPDPATTTRSRPSGERTLGRRFLNQALPGAAPVRAARVVAVAALPWPWHGAQRAGGRGGGRGGSPLVDQALPHPQPGPARRLHLQ